MAFLDVLFPKEFCISYQSTMGEQFNTRIGAPGGNAPESRNSEWGENSHHVFEPVTNLIGVADLERLQAFHALVQGRAYAFRLEWPGDNVAVDSLIDTSAGGTTFQLRKQYQIPIYNYNEDAEVEYLDAFKPIYLCIPETAFLKLNGIELPVEENPFYLPLWNGPLFNEGAQSASISNSGVITLAEAITSEDILTATFNFQYICRFINDEMRITLVNFGAYSAQCPITEVYGEDVDG